MCFSAAASFGASALLGTVGVISLRKVKTRKQVLFAAIPVFFAIQQFSEGFVWLSLHNPAGDHSRLFPAYVFVIFALLVWPVWLPLSIWLLEENRRIKKLLLAAVGFGFVFSLIVGFYLFTHTVFPEIKDHHIHYALGFSGGLLQNASLLYFIPTILPPFFSSLKEVKILGVFLLVSYLVSKFYFAQAVVSVWCFLAASISLIVWWALVKVREREALSRRPVVLVEDILPGKQV